MARRGACAGFRFQGHVHAGRGLKGYMLLHCTVLFAMGEGPLGIQVQTRLLLRPYARAVA